jgi:hypothetical protein
MGVVAASSTSASAAAGGVALGAGGVFVAVALGFLLAYLDLLDASTGRHGVRAGLEAVVTTLFTTFLLVVVVETAQTIQYVG